MAITNIEEYLTKYTGFAPRYKYRVYLAIPSAAEISGINMAAEFPGDRCIDTTIPGRYLATTEHRYVGPVVKNPYNTYFDDLTMLFVCDEKMTERNYFARWLEAVYDDKYNMNYKDEYKANFIIEQHNHNSEVIYRVEIFEAYPIALEGSPLNYGSAGEGQNFQVRFNYRDFRERYPTEGVATSDVSF